MPQIQKGIGGTLSVNESPKNVNELFWLTLY